MMRKNSLDQSRLDLSLKAFGGPLPEVDDQDGVETDPNRNIEGLADEARFADDARRALRAPSALGEVVNAETRLRQVDGLIGALRDHAFNTLHLNEEVLVKGEGPLPNIYRALVREATRLALVKRFNDPKVGSQERVRWGYNMFALELEEHDNDILVDSSLNRRAKGVFTFAVLGGIASVASFVCLDGFGVTAACAGGTAGLICKGFVDRRDARAPKRGYRILPELDLSAEVFHQLGPLRQIDQAMNPTWSNYDLDAANAAHARRPAVVDNVGKRLRDLDIHARVKAEQDLTTAALREFSSVGPVGSITYTPDDFTRVFGDNADMRPSTELTEVIDDRNVQVAGFRTVLGSLNCSDFILGGRGMLPQFAV